MAEFPPDTSSTPSPAPARPPPVREDCWSEEATSTLIEAWGQRYLELNRGNLRQKQWQEVADAVNASHGHVKKARRTDVQCKNRIDTLKKKYKVEKSRVLESGGVYRSPWPFFAPLDRLIANLPIKKVASSPIASSSPAAIARSSSPAVTNSAGNARSSSPMMIANLTANAPRSIVNSMANANAPSPAIARSNSAAIVNSAAMKRPLAAVTPFRAEESSYFRKNYSAIAAAAAAAAAESEDDEDEEEEVEEEEGDEEEEVEEMRGGEAEGIRKLAKVIEKFGEVYARVEAEKQRQMIELEKQRMQFAKELECQRMQMMVEMQVQLEKIKRAKRSDDSNGRLTDADEEYPEDAKGPKPRVQEATVLRNCVRFVGD